MTDGVASGAGRGILRRRTARDRFHVDRRAPAADLAWAVDYLWILTWDLRGREPHRQQVLSGPSVNMTFTTGGRARIVGVVRDVFTETIAGEGRVVGVRFRPGGFRPFLDGPVSGLTGRMVPVEEVFGAEARRVADAVIAESRTDRAVALLEEFLRKRAPASPDPVVAEIDAIITRVADSPGLLRVDELATAAGTGARRLQRIFAEYVGVGPKWVIRRHRIQEAAERAGQGTGRAGQGTGRAGEGAGVDWAALSAELGYADQAHFTRDFTGVMGVPPARYARGC